MKTPKKIHRFLAVVIDYLLINGFLFCMDYANTITQSNQYISYKNSLMLAYFYFWLTTKYFNATLGHTIMGLRVVSSTEGKEPEWWFRAIMKMPFISLINGISFLITKNMWYDKSCKTMVVYKKELKSHENTKQNIENNTL